MKVYFHAVLAAALAVATAFAAVTHDLLWLAGAAGALSFALLLLPASATGDIPEQAARPWLLVLGFLALLALKDLWPASPVSGVIERRAALATPLLAWPATARNPALGLSAAHLAALTLSLVLVIALANSLAGSARRRWVALQLTTWGVTAFGLALPLVTDSALPYGPDNAVGAVLSKNSAATLAALGLLLQAGLAASAAWRGALTLGAIHACAGLALGPVLTRLGSWTALVALGAGLLGWLWVAAGRTRIVGRGAALGLGAAVVLLAVLSLATLEPRLAGRVADFGTDFRWQIWRDTLPMLREYPCFGVGLGAFASVYPLFGQLGLPADARLAHPDSSWVLLLLEWGTLPLALALAAGLPALGRLGRRLRAAAQEGEFDPAGHLAAAGLIAWLLAGCTDATWHRPETLVVGVALAGIAVAQPERRAPLPAAPRRVLAPAAIVLPGLVLAGGLAAWAAHPARQELRWGLLDPARHWVAAVRESTAGPPSPAQIARFTAAVKLQHRAVTYPVAAAHALHARDPEAALPFWRLALTRDADRGPGTFADAVRAFPATPAEYWVRLAAITDPDYALLIPGLPPAELVGAISSWLVREHVQPPSAGSAHALLSAVARAGCADLLAAAVDRLPAASPEFWEQAARLLLAGGHPGPAWTALLRRLPPDDASPATPASAGAISPRLLLQLHRYVELRSWLLSSATGAERRKLLEEICASADAPAWFHLRLARALAADGDPAAAVARALHGLAKSAAPAR